MTKYKILDIVDMQNSFISPKGILYIKESEYLIEKANTYLKNIPKDYFDAVLIKQDTHFKEEYTYSNEAKEFPIHCEYETYDWELAINIKLINNKNILRLLKNKFDMWESNLNSQSLFNNNNIYSKLYKILDESLNNIKYNNITEFLNKYPVNETTIYLFGVASDYCTMYALDGYLKLGYPVKIISSLTKGINKDINDVIKQDNYKKYIDQIILI